MIFATSNSLAEPLCLSLEIEQKYLYLGGESRGMWKNIFTPAFLSLGFVNPSFVFVLKKNFTKKNGTSKKLIFKKKSSPPIQIDNCVNLFFSPPSSPPKFAESNTAIPLASDHPVGLMTHLLEKISFIDTILCSMTLISHMQRCRPTNLLFLWSFLKLWIS